MKISARPLLVLHDNEEFRERVRKVAGKEYTFQSVPDWPALEESVRDSPPSALVVVHALLAVAGFLTLLVAEYALMG